MALSHLGEHTGDLLCCTLIEEAVETDPAFQALNFPLKAYYFLHAAPPLTVHQAAAFLHPKAMQRYHSGVTPKPRPASLLPTDIWACDEPQAESLKSRSTQSNPAMPPSFCPWKVSSTIYKLVSCRSKPQCFYCSNSCSLCHGGAARSSAKVPGQHHHSPLQGLILPGTHPASETAALLPVCKSIVKHSERKHSVQSKLGLALGDL